jgi:hypothetical protein
MEEGIQDSSVPVERACCWGFPGWIEFSDLLHVTVESPELQYLHFILSWASSGVSGPTTHGGAVGKEGAENMMRVVEGGVQRCEGNWD